MRLTSLEKHVDFMQKLRHFRRTREVYMGIDKESVRLNLAVSQELNDRLEQMAAASHTSKSDILRKAIALFDVVSEAKSEKKRFGILDQDKRLLTEIVGI